MIDGEELQRRIDLYNQGYWEMPEGLDTSTFDFSWRPDPWDRPYIHQFGTQWQRTGGPRFVVPQHEGIKFQLHQRAIKLPSSESSEWRTLCTNAWMDFSWHPDDTDPPYNYVFGNQWYDSKTMPTVQFRVEGATEEKHVEDVRARLLPSKDGWNNTDDVSEDFDYSWVPNPKDPPYIYHWGCKFFPVEIKHFAEYIVPGATQIKYVTEPIELNVDWDRWIIPDNIDRNSFDFSWRPDPREPNMTYQFGTQWQKTGGPTYIMPDSQGIKYINEQVATVLPDKSKFKAVIDVEDFDYSWHPDDTEPPFIYVFGNKWYDVKSMPTVEYHVDGATEYKYMNDPVAKLKANEQAWEVMIPVSSFDFSWIPEPNAEPYIYVFGNKWNDAQTEPTLTYKVDGATEYKFVSDIVATPAVNMTNWSLRNDKDKDVFDFSWRPNPNARIRYEWGTDGPVYTVPDYTSIVNVEYVRDTTKIDLLEVADTYIERPMFFIDRGNPESFDRFNELKIKYPQLQKTRYLNSWIDTINRCCVRSTEDLFWVLSSELDYTDFVFDYNPNPWQKKMIHVFGSQWTHWGNTFLINKTTFSEDTKYIKLIEHLNILNFVKDKKAKANECIYDVVLINHGNSQHQDVLELLQTKIPNRTITSVEYEYSYFYTFKKLLKTLEEKKEYYLWVCSSVCDYRDFDFSYVCDPFSKEQLHAFPSDKQKFGDTFLVNITKLRELVAGMSMLEDYKKINFNQHQRVPRLTPPTIITQDDTHCESVLQEFDFPYAIFKTQDTNVNVIDSEPMNLWAEGTKNIMIASTGGTAIIAPREVKYFVKRELYDYPYIAKASSLVKSEPIDIVFFSNGEACAEENYEHLLSLNLPNRVVRVDGVNGRVASQYAAASAAETTWYFLVNAKLRVNESFDFNWQPDRLQIPKHYIFHALNSINKLEYGHMAMVANNKNLTLSTKGTGLDFTMESSHEVVELLSGTAILTSEWDVWRTAFRECVKLCHAKDAKSRERLKVWTTIAEGSFAQYSLQGAQDAVEYYHSVNGDFEKLKLSYDWAWLREKFNK